MNFKRLFRKRKTAGSLTYGVTVRQCRDCLHENIAMQFLAALTWDTAGLLLGYDRESKAILVNKDELMRLIRVANPAQPMREIHWGTVTITSHGLSWTDIERDAPLTPDSED